MVFEDRYLYDKYRIAKQQNGNKRNLSYNKYTSSQMSLLITRGQGIIAFKTPVSYRQRGLLSVYSPETWGTINLYIYKGTSTKHGGRHGELVTKFASREKLVEIKPFWGKSHLLNLSIRLPAVKVRVSI